MNISNYCDSLQKDCGFISIESTPTLDGYGTITTVHLTDEQARVWKRLNRTDIKELLFKSEHHVCMTVRHPNFLKPPKVQFDNRNTIRFYGDEKIAAVFFYSIFAVKT